MKQDEQFAKAFTERGYTVTVKTFTHQKQKVSLMAKLIRLFRKCGTPLHDAIIVVYDKKISVHRKSTAKHN